MKIDDLRMVMMVYANIDDFWGYPDRKPPNIPSGY
jgi:hypothetical protein